MNMLLSIVAGGMQSRDTGGMTGPDFLFRAADYGAEVAAILALDGEPARERLRELSSSRCFAGARAAKAALAGLYVYFSCFEEAHTLAQDIATPEGSYWHALVHRHEPDAANAAYWFGRVGTHPIFPALARAAGREGPWDPFAFIAFCDRARRQPGSAQMKAAMEIQRVEWQILFDYCARLSESQ